MSKKLGKNEVKNSTSSKILARFRILRKFKKLKQKFSNNG